MDSGGFVGARRPIHAFYMTQSPIDASSSSASPSSVTKTTKPAFLIQPTIANIHVHPTIAISTTKSIQATSSSSIHFILSKSPPLIQQQETTVNRINHQQMHESQQKGQPWLAPLIGILTMLGIFSITFLFCMCKRRYRRRRHHPSSGVDNDPIDKSMPPSHESWASISTIQTSMLNEDKLMKIQPPPTYDPKAHKRLTADTLVEEPSVLMLKNQYSPQLAFSPSLAAGEFPQQQQLQEQPPLPIISPSNTLIDHASVLNIDEKIQEESYSTRRRIEIYDPQVNIQHKPPYSYLNDQEKK